MRIVRSSQGPSAAGAKPPASAAADRRQATDGRHRPEAVAMPTGLLSIAGSFESAHLERPPAASRKGSRLMKKSRLVVSSFAALSLLTVPACVTDPTTGEKKVSRTAIGA